MKMAIYVLMVCWLVCTVPAGTLRQRKNYQVDTVTQVISPLEFECKLKDFPYAKAARFRVTIQNIELIPGEIDNDKAKQLLLQSLAGANVIQLQNVKVRNYFRLYADVFVNDKDLLETYVASNLAKAVAPPIEAQEAKKSKPETQHTQAKQPPVSWFSRSASVPAATHGGTQISSRYVSLEQLLSTEVDLSMMNSDTTFEEALDIMKHSVKPNLPLLVLWNDLETNALIDKDQPIGVSGFGKMKLATAMKVVMNSVASASSSQLVLVPEGRVLTLGTRAGLDYKPVTRVYSIEDLTLPPSFANEFNRYSQSSGSGRSSGRSGRNSSSGSRNSGR